MGGSQGENGKRERKLNGKTFTYKIGSAGFVLVLSGLPGAMNEMMFDPPPKIPMATFEGRECYQNLNFRSTPCRLIGAAKDSLPPSDVASATVVGNVARSIVGA